MNTIQEIKNSYAQEQGYEDWETLIHSVINHAGINGRYAAIITVEKHLNEVCLRAQKAALENAAENAVTTTEEHYIAGHIGLTADRVIIDRSSITNEQNLIR